MEDRNFTTINNDYIKGDNALTCDELSTLLLISMNKTVKNQYIFTIKHLLNLTYNDKNLNRKVDTIKNILKQLNYDKILYYYKSTRENSNNILDIDTIDRNDLIFATDNILLDGNFTMIYDDDIYSILKDSNKYNIDINILLSIYVYICSYLNNNKQDENYKLCYVAHETICNDLNIAENTLLKYIEVLNDINIIRSDYAGYKETAKGKIKNEVMYYCRCEDENILIKRLADIRKDKGILKLNNRSKKKSNTKRSIKQIINNLERKNKNNTINDIESVKLELLKKEYNNMDSTKVEK